MRSPLPRSSGTGCAASSASLALPRSTPRGSTGSPAWLRAARRRCGRPRQDVTPRRPTSRLPLRPRPTRASSRPTRRRSPARGAGSALSPAPRPRAGPPPRSAPTPRAAGPAALIDDDLAYVSGWGFDPLDITAPTLVVHGGADRIVPASHGQWLARAIRGAELWLQPGGGHISVLGTAEDALTWLARTARRS